MSLSPDINNSVSQKMGLIPTYPDQTNWGESDAVAGVLGITSFGVRFGLSASQADLLQDGLLYLPHGCKRSVSVSRGSQYSLVRFDNSSQDEPGYRLYRDRRLLFTCGDRRELLERFRSIVALHVAEVSTRRTFIHAGVVGWGGFAVLIPGRSFSGKTTLVAQLVRAGATYYSDEFAVVDKRGLIYPYAQPLQVRDSASPRQTERPVEEFGGVAGSKPLPAGLVIISRYKPGAKWNPRKLSPGMGLLKILDNTVSARRSPQLVLGTLKQVVADAVIVGGVRGEASQMIDWIAAHFESAQKPECEP